ncbi:MAG: cadmium-translocating P-type ATPase [Alteromonadaceae bacterium]|nr:cadmium-translocating P-type ATPase [Alteromonadaceae bacterium]
MSKNCFHCDELIPNSVELTVTINKVAQPMCCIGCQAVAEAIVANNLTDYYNFRSESAQKGAKLVPKQLERNQLLDDESLQNEFTYTIEDAENQIQNTYENNDQEALHKKSILKETILSIDGISCAACAWLIEMQTAKIDGVNNITVNATTQRATIRWQSEKVKLSDIINTIASIGYQALPFKASTSEQANIRQSKSYIKRLGIAGILMMQVLMIAIGLYFGAFADMSEYNLIYLRWTSLLLTLPIVTYAALPFYIGATRTLKSKRLSMDVPVSIAIILAFCASVWATLSQQGEVYFESVAMFTFLLLIGKFLEFRARARAAEVSANLLKLMPMAATKIVNDQEVLIAAKKLIAKDIVLIKPGEVVPADGVIITGSSQLNEAMLSGEPLPINKTSGDQVFAGTINGDGNLTIAVKHSSNQSFLSQLIRLSESSQAHKPKLARLSNKIAQYFIAVILVTAIATALYWQQKLPEQAFWITLSVLVATCPCALSLATPTALTCATTQLNRSGIMIKSSHVMETLPKIDCIAFDKTGTLTSGEFVISYVLVIDKRYNENTVLAIASALESYSEHPLAKAFNPYRDFTYKNENIIVHSGSGISGTLNNKSMKIGKVSWLLSGVLLEKYQDAQCVLVEKDQLIAVFYLEDKIRDDAEDLLKYFNKNNIKTLMISGDNQHGCDKISNQLSIDEVSGNLSAKDKMAIIKNKQKNLTVAMVGDGVNDTPVFGVSHVSIAMGSGTDIAKNGADVILLNNKLSNIKNLREIARKTRTIIWQNYCWAFGYNALILPLAVTGHVTPYMAVIGMSASSILVITNSLRLLNK